MQDYQLRQRDYLLRISRAMTARLDLPSLLELTLRSAVEIVRGQVGLIVLRGRDGVMRVQASYGLPERLVRFFQPLWADLPGIGSEELEGIVSRWHIPDLQMRLGMVAAAAGLALSQVVALPLVIEDELIGVVYVFRIRGGAFSASDRALLAAFADQAAIAVRNAELYQRVIEEQQSLSAIIENSAEGVMILKKTYWYRMSYSGGEPLAPQTKEDITEARWLRPEELSMVVNNTYSSIVEVLEAGNLL